MKTVADVLVVFELAALNAGLARNTRKTYAATIREFSECMKSAKISGPQDYFDHLASVKKLSPASVHHALNPLKFLYEKVLCKEFGTDYQLPKRNRCKPMRSVLSMQEILRMMETMERIPRLQAGLLAGCGLRIESDMLTLRLKDIRLADRIITIFDAKGGKNRPVKIPEFLTADLDLQIKSCIRQWQKDRLLGIICPHPQESLMRKFSTATFGTLPWYWLFPSANIRGINRWHSTSKRLVSALRDGVDLRAIQEQMGHTSLETTELYLHTSGGNTVRSPLDTAADRNIIPIRKNA